MAKYNQVGVCSICGRSRPIKCVSTNECSGCYARRRYQLVAKVGKSWWSDVADVTYEKIIKNLREMGLPKAADMLATGIKQRGCTYNWGFQRLQIPVKTVEVLEDDGIVESDEKYLDCVKPRFLPDWDEDNYAYEILTKKEGDE
jgi:hypothetical protein